MPWSTHGDFRLTDEEMMPRGRTDEAARDRRGVRTYVSSAHFSRSPHQDLNATFVLPAAGSMLRTDQLNEDLMQARRWLEVQPFRSP